MDPVQTGRFAELFVGLREVPLCAVEFFPRKKTVTSRYFSSGQGSGAYFVER